MSARASLNEGHNVLEREISPTSEEAISCQYSPIPRVQGTFLNFPLCTTSDEQLCQRLAIDSYAPIVLSTTQKIYFSISSKDRFFRQKVHDALLIVTVLVEVDAPRVSQSLFLTLIEFESTCPKSNPFRTVQLFSSQWDSFNPCFHIPCACVKRDTRLCMCQLFVRQS